MGTVAMPAIDFLDLLHDIPRGAWVAISVSESGARVICYGSEIQKVIHEANKLGEARPVIMRVPESPTSLMM